MYYEFTQKKNYFGIIITFSSYSFHTRIIFLNQLNILPFKHLLFLRIGLQMFKYESGQLPDALNMFLLRIDLCIIIIHETRTTYILLLLNMHTETETFFDLLVHMFRII